jgi:hypothetical protein
MKLFSVCFNRYSIAITFLLALTQLAHAQTPEDALMIPKNYMCPALMFGSSSWDHYWEGTYKRDNQNIGTLSSKMYTAAVVYGITNNINAIASASYVSTHASMGTLTGLKGMQDLNLTLKWRAYRTYFGTGRFSVFAIGSASLPLSNYQADYLPVAIGSRSKSLMFRGMLDYNLNKFFITGSGEYMHRSDITIDRTAYYTTGMHYTNEVALPNMTNFAARTGYRSSHLIAEAIIQKNTTIGGFDIRKNDMPFPSNRMNATLAGVNFKYSFSGAKGLELSAGGDYVLDGQNVGQSTMFHGGVDYLFSLSKK